jgi:hypothetical protein
MHLLVGGYGQPGWVAALTALSVEEMIVAASTTLLADAQSGRPAGALSCLLLGAQRRGECGGRRAGDGRPDHRRLALFCPDRLLRAGHAADPGHCGCPLAASAASADITHSRSDPDTRGGVALAGAPRRTSQRAVGSRMQQEALEWAMANRRDDGKLTGGKAIADQFGRHERWGRLVKQYGADYQVAADTEGVAALPGPQPGVKQAVSNVGVLRSCRKSCVCRDV